MLRTLAADRARIAAFKALESTMLRTLAADRARIAALDAEILKLEPSLAALRLQKSVTQERLDSYKYPVLTLPNELTSEIFTQFVPAYPLCPTLSGPSSPNILTQICRRWRQVALATPALWRAIQLSVLDGSPITLRRDDMLESWLARSHRQSLSVEIIETASWVSPRVFTAICAQNERLQFLKLDILPDLPRFGAMPLLSHLSLNLRRHSSSITTFDDVPRLRSVVLNEFAARSIILPWRQLTSLTLRCVYLRNCVPILRETPKLVHCELSLLDAYGDRPEFDITLPAGSFNPQSGE